MVDLGVLCIRRGVINYAKNVILQTKIYFPVIMESIDTSLGNKGSFVSMNLL
jgi:hypothetical protein